MHVDGAYGAAAALTDEGTAALAGLERADSVSLDPHKWLFQPFEIGCVLLRDGRRLEQTFHVLPEYLKIILGSGRRGQLLRLWPATYARIPGAQALDVDQGLRPSRIPRSDRNRARERPLCRASAVKLRTIGRVVTPANLGVVTFRYRPAGLAEADGRHRVNLGISEKNRASGYAMVMTTELRGTDSSCGCVRSIRGPRRTISKARFGAWRCSASEIVASRE